MDQILKDWVQVFVVENIVLDTIAARIRSPSSANGKWDSTNLTGILPV